MRLRFSPKAILLSTLLLLPPIAGCQIFSFVARAIPKMVPAVYTGLKGKEVAVLVWTDRAISNDWPEMAFGVGNTLRAKLMTAQKENKPKDLDGTTFPVTPQSIAKFQLEHPEAELSPITDVAPQIGVRRLIYVEITRFQTRSDMAVNTDLYLGQIVANVKVVEYENGKSKIGYAEDNVMVKFPKKSPADGTSGLGDVRTYVGTLDALTTEVAWKFYKHEVDRDAGE